MLVIEPDVRAHAKRTCPLLRHLFKMCESFINWVHALLVLFWHMAVDMPQWTVLLFLLGKGKGIGWHWFTANETSSLFRRLAYILLSDVRVQLGGFFHAFDLTPWLLAIKSWFKYLFTFVVDCLLVCKFCDSLLRPFHNPAYLLLPHILIYLLNIKTYTRIIIWHTISPTNAHQVLFVLFVLSNWRNWTWLINFVILRYNCIGLILLLVCPILPCTVNTFQLSLLFVSISRLAVVVFGKGYDVV